MLFHAMVACGICPAVLGVAEPYHGMPIALEVAFAARGVGTCMVLMN